MAIKVDRVRDFFEQVETEVAGSASRNGANGNEHFRTEENMKNGNNGNGSSGFFVPSKEYQNVPDWAAMPNGGEYKVNIDTGVNQARWDTPPGPETVIDKRTGKPQTVGFPQEADQKNRRADDMTDAEIDKLADERESLLSYEDWRKRVLPDDANITEGQARAAWHRNVAQIARDKGAIRNGESTTLQVLRVYKGKLLEAAKRAQKAGDRALKIAQALQEDESNATKIGGRDVPGFTSFDDLMKSDLPEPKRIIDGILGKGQKMSLNAGSKEGKTWILIDLAISLAKGWEWLGRGCARSKVLYVNFELQEHFLKKRCQIISKHREIEGSIPDLHTWTLRGFYPEPDQFKNAVLKNMEGQNFDVIIVDPVYKLMNGADENAAGEIAKMLAGFEEIASRAGASFIYAHHFSKGNQSTKDAIDRSSGSGVFGRDPDAIITISQHAKDDCRTVDFIIRNYKPVESFVVRWNEDGCRYIPAPEENPKDLKTNSPPKKFTPELVLSFLNNDGLDYSAWESLCTTQGLMSPGTFENLRKKLERDGRIHKSKLDGKWKKTAKQLIKEGVEPGPPEEEEASAEAEPAKEKKSCRQKPRNQAKPRSGRRRRGPVRLN